MSACGRDAAGGDTGKPPVTDEKPLPPDPEPLMGIVCPTPPEVMGEVVVVPEEMGRIAVPRKKADDPDETSEPKR